MLRCALGLHCVAEFFKASDLDFLEQTECAAYPNVMKSKKKA